MTQWELSRFYDGVCNAAFWPLYHDAVVDPVFRDEEFEVYRRINQRFLFMERAFIDFERGT